MAARAQHPQRMLDRPDVRGITGLSDRTIDRLEAAGKFPRRRKISTRRVGWLESEVVDWQESLTRTAS